VSVGLSVENKNLLLPSYYRKTLTKCTSVSTRRRRTIFDCHGHHSCCPDLALPSPIHRGRNNQIFFIDERRKVLPYPILTLGWTQNEVKHCAVNRGQRRPQKPRLGVVVVAVAVVRGASRKAISGNISSRNIDDGRVKGVLSKIAKAGRRAFRPSSPRHCASSLKEARILRRTILSRRDASGVNQLVLRPAEAYGGRRSPLWWASPEASFPETDAVRLALQVPTERVRERR
jgi:hypothetical protein